MKQEATFPWVLCRVVGKRTISASLFLNVLGVETYCPCLVRRVRISKMRSRYRHSVYAAFPGWLFLKSPVDEGMLNLQLGFRINPVARYDDASVQQLRGWLEDFSMRDLDEKDLVRFAPGDVVTTAVGPFQGMKMTVLEVNGSSASVDAGGFFQQVEINTFLLKKFGT